jgi:catechol 2,3-dioxygenase-like lactoylglutathione lyase family enzyme
MCNARWSPFVPIPKPNYNPPFNVTRASDAVLGVKNLAKSRAFYVDLIGFIVSDEDKDAIYLRGVAEAWHHSLVLKRAAAAQVERVGLRCFSDEDLEQAKFYFDKAALPAQCVERPYQGRTLHVRDAFDRGKLAVERTITLGIAGHVVEQDRGRQPAVFFGEHVGDGAHLDVPMGAADTLKLAELFDRLQPAAQSAIALALCRRSARDAHLRCLMAV